MGSSPGQVNVICHCARKFTLFTQEYGYYERPGKPDEMLGGKRSN